jgi:ATP-binding cassette subfamily F protein 3
LLVHDGKITPYDGDLNDYQQWLQSKDSQPCSDDNTKKIATDSGQSKKAQRYQNAEIRRQLQPLKNKIKKLESTLAELNEKYQTITKTLNSPEIYQDQNKDVLKNTLQEQHILSQQIEENEEKWLNLSEQIEEKREN